MKIVDVGGLLSHRDSDPLRLQRLGALEPRQEPYLALLCQPHGTLHASFARIGNADPPSVVPMYRAFLGEAVECQAQLVITPEYSVPWALIRNITLDEHAPRPPVGSLWVLGCESITSGELDALQGDLAGTFGVRLIHEPFDEQRRAQTVFVDPLIFLFWAIDRSDALVLCLLVQFKTVASRDPEHVELQSLYLGTRVYKFTPQAGDVSLLALVCSDAFEFTNALVDEHGGNLLLIHIQLNQKPGYVDYAAYRTRLFSVASNNNVEVVCLNWAAHVTMEAAAAQPWNSIAGSAWYIAPRGITPTDADVNQLHRDGMYYSIVGERWHAFYLNYSPHSLLVRKQRVFVTGPQVLAQRVPPKVVARRTWDPERSLWASAPADDGFNELVKQYRALPATLAHLCPQDPLAVERALELLEGPHGQASDWYKLNGLRALRVAEEESLRSVTVNQENDAARQGVAFRRHRVRCAQTAATVPGQAVAWPTPVADLASGFRYRWTAADPHSNVEPIDGGRSAALVYLGEDPEIDAVSNIYAKLKKARRIHAFVAAEHAGVDPSDEVTLAQDRLCVVYKENHTLRFYRPPAYASITDPGGRQADDIAGD